MKPKNSITTKITPKKKPHTNFKQLTYFDSIPVIIETESENTTTEIKDLRKNPNKYSFGQIAFKNGLMEAYIYPQNCLHSVIWGCNKTGISKGVQFTIDNRKRKELSALTRKIGYFLCLSAERKLIYLRNHGYSANIILRRNMKA